MIKPDCKYARRREAIRRGGFTLLEVLLALALGVLVLVAIGVAIDVHLRAVNAGRVQVEQGQLARAVLGHIADDLRGALRYQPFDASALSNVQSPLGDVDTSMLDDAISGAAGGSSGGTSSGSSTKVTDLSKTSTGTKGATGGSISGGSSSGGGKGSGGSKGASSGGNGSSGSGSKSTTGSSTKSSGSSGGNSSGSTVDSSGSGNSSNDTSEQTEPVQVPGVYGTETELHIDLSRLPRADERLSGPQLGDVKTVAYFVSNASADGAGLRRSTTDRSATLWSNSQGTTQTAQAGELVAPEVVAVEFQYFDGAEWHTTWDSTEKKGLPLAIEVAISVAGGTNRNAPTSSLFSTDPGSDSSGVYRLLVHLPAAEPPSTSSTSTSSNSSSEESP